MLDLLLIKLLLIFFALLPGGLLAGFFITHFRRRLGGELVAIALGLGVISAFLVLAVIGMARLFPSMVEPAASPLLDALNEAVFTAAIPEEAAKFLLLMTIVKRHEDCDSGGDLFCSAVLIGLGFAAVENVLYLIESGPHWLGLGLLRGALAVPGHATFGIIMGHFVAASQRRERDGDARNGGARNGAGMQAQRYRLQFLGLLCPIAAHALYDFPLMASRALSGTYDDVSIYLATRLIYAELTVLVGAAGIAWVIARRELVAIYLRRLDRDLLMPSRLALLPWRVLGWLMIVGAGLCLAYAGWMLSHGDDQALFLLLPSVFPLTFGCIMQMRPPLPLIPAPVVG